MSDTSSHRLRTMHAAETMPVFVPNETDTHADLSAKWKTIASTCMKENAVFHEDRYLSTFANRTQTEFQKTYVVLPCDTLMN